MVAILATAALWTAWGGIPGVRSAMHNQLTHVGRQAVGRLVGVATPLVWAAVSFAAVQADLWGPRRTADYLIGKVHRVEKYIQARHWRPKHAA